MYNIRYINSSNNKSKAMWKVIMEELEKNKIQIKNIKLKSDDKEICDPKEIAHIFNDYYTNLAENILGNCLPNRNNITKSIEIPSSIFLNPTNESEVINIIKQFQNKQSAGVDDISDYLVKKCYLNIVSPLTFIINLSLSSGQFPDRLKVAKVKPLYKKGVQTEIENYRPVSLHLCSLK